MTEVNTSTSYKMVRVLNNDPSAAALIRQACAINNDTGSILDEEKNEYHIDRFGSYVGPVHPSEKQYAEIVNTLEAVATKRLEEELSAKKKSKSPWAQ